MTLDTKMLQSIYEAWGIAPEDAQTLGLLGERAATRILFQLAVWDGVIDDMQVEGEYAWIESWMRYARRNDKPQRGTAAAIERVLDAGADPSDLTAIVRAMQVELVHTMCGLLDCEGLKPYDEAAPNHPTSGWRLFEINSNGQPVRAIESLHEDIDDFDPLNSDGIRNS